MYFQKRLAQLNAAIIYRISKLVVRRYMRKSFILNVSKVEIPKTMILTMFVCAFAHANF